MSFRSSKCTSQDEEVLEFHCSRNPKPIANTSTDKGLTSMTLEAFADVFPCQSPARSCLFLPEVQVYLKMTFELFIQVRIKLLSEDMLSCQ